MPALENTRSNLDDIYRRIATGSALYFCLSFLLLHYIRDDLQLWHTTLSIYAVGTGGWILSMGFYGIAVAQLLIAYRFYQLHRSKADLVTVLVLILAAVGALLVAMFPYTVKAPHNTGAVLQLGLFPLALCLRVILHREDALWRFSFSIALLTTLCFLLMLGHGLELFDLFSFGFVEKAEIACIALWLLCYSYRGH